MASFQVDGEPGGLYHLARDPGFNILRLYPAGDRYSPDMHFMARIALCLLAGLPTVGLAQTADVPVASPEVSTPPPLLTAPPEPTPAPPESETPPARGELIPRRVGKERSALRVSRIVTGTLLGALTGAGGGILGLLAGDKLSSCTLFEGGCAGGELLLFAAPAVLGMGALSSLTVYTAGSLLDGRGTIVSALLGSFAGAGIGMLAIVGGEEQVGIGLMPPLAAIGAVIAYEISDSHWEPEPAQGPSAGSNLQLIPVFGVTPGGGVLGGLSGRF